MCTLADYKDLSLDGEHRQFLENELEKWHDDYLPLRGPVVLDVGAGCGETARFYLLHGAERVIAIEGDEEAFLHLSRNFIHDRRVVMLYAHVDKIKIDIEGSEEDLDLEVHFEHEWELRRHSDGIWQTRLTRTGGA